MGPLLRLLIPFVVGCAVIALMVAWPISLPPLRRVGQANPRARRIETISAGVISALLTYLLVTYMLVAFSLTMVSVWEDNAEQSGVDEPLPETRQLPVMIVAQEVLLRTMLPRPIRSACMTTTESCAQADSMLRVLSSEHQPGYGWRATPFGLGIQLVFVSLSGLSSAGLVWLFTGDQNRLPRRPYGRSKEQKINA